MRFQPETLTGETRYVQLKFSKILLFLLRIQISFQLVSFICRFLKSETSLNFSNFDRQDFVKIQNFDGYDIIMTSFTN